MITLGRMGTTREAILAILRRHAGVSVEDLSRELELSGATVRRHLDVLLRDGYIAVRQVRGRTGRPRHAYSLTERGAELFGHHYVRMTHRLVDEIAALGADETAGRRGADLAELIFDKMSERLVREYRPRIVGSTLIERVHATVALLAEEGIDFDVIEESDDGDAGAAALLLGRGCPCKRLNGGQISGCDHDRRLLEELVGAFVEPVAADELPNEFLCGYRLQSRPQ